MGYLIPNSSIVVDGVSTSDNQTTQNTLLGNILTAVGSRFSFAETIWVDSDTPPKYWVMRTSQNPDTYEINSIFSSPVGIIGTPVGNITPASNTSNIFTSSIDYDVNINGTGYSIGDILTKTLIREVNGGAILETFWYNQNTESVISAINIDYSKIEKSTETVNIRSESLGSIGDVMATGEVGGFSINSLLKRISYYIKGLFDKDFSTSTKQDTSNGYLNTISTKDFSTSTKQDTSNGYLNTISTKDFSTSTKQDTLINNVGATNDVLANSDSGTFSLISLTKRISNHLTNLNTKDFSTSTKQDTSNGYLNTISTKDFLTQTDFDTRFGEVQSSPTANTLLDRIKALLTGISLAASGATIGKVGIDQTAGQNVVAVSTRVCVSHQGITVPITTGVTLASLCSGGIIPVGAIACEIQALDAVVRYSLDASTVTPTTGMRLNVDDKVPIDSALASVRLVAQSGVAACSVAFFDRV